MNGPRFHRGALLWGVLFVVLGVLFLLEEFGTIDLDAATILPIVLIATGAAVILGARRPPSEEPEPAPPPPDASPNGQRSDDEDRRESD